MCRQQLATLCLLFIVLCGAFSECQGETRCDAICNYDSLREQCDRCRLRIPMRFGKRSSPPDEAFLESSVVESPDFLRQLKAADDLSSQFLQYLSQTLQRRSRAENGGGRSRLEEDVGQPKRRAIAQLNDWSANPMGMIRKKRALQSSGKFDRWLRRAILARPRQLLEKPKDVPSLATELFH